MISMSAAIQIVITLIVAGLIFGLLAFLINYCAAQFPSVAPFTGVARVILMILAVLVCIGVLLSLVGGTPIFRP